MPDKPETFGDLIPGNRLARPVPKPQPPKPAPVDDCPIVEEKDWRGWNRTKDNYRPVTHNWAPLDVRQAIEKAEAEAGTVEELDEAIARGIAAGRPLPTQMSPRRRKYLMALAEKYREPVQVLGDEAETAECETCSVPHRTDDLTEGVPCEACGGFFCRRKCFLNHECDKTRLVSWNGQLVKTGDKLKYHDGNARIWEVIEIRPTFSKYGIAHGQCKDLTLPIRPRLMFHV